MNSINRNQYDKILDIKINNEIMKTQNSLISGINAELSPYGELVKLDEGQQKEVLSFFKKIHQDIPRAQLIAFKIITGERLTKEELNFIEKECPELKQWSEKSAKEIKVLRLVIKKCETDNDRKQVILNETNNIKNMVTKGEISQIQAKIKLATIEEVVKFSNKIKQETNKAEIIATKIIKGEKLTTNEHSFIIEKYPDLKQTAEQSAKGLSELEIKLKNCRTEEEKQGVICSLIKKLEGKSKSSEVFLLKSKLEIVEKEEIIKMPKRIEIELRKAEKIVSKMLKGDKVTLKELRFINEKYPEMNQVVKQVKIEQNSLKEELKNYKIFEERQQIIFNKIKTIEELLIRGEISEFQLKMRKTAILSIKEIEEDYKNEIKFNLNPFIYLNSRELLDKGTAIIIFISVVCLIYLFGKILT